LRLSPHSVAVVRFGLRHFSRIAQPRRAVNPSNSIVRPDRRGAGLARSLYEQFGDLARRQGCRELAAITSATNIASIQFHRRLGFTVSEPRPNYNGPGTTMITFRRPAGLRGT
jgi:GNAT superfamily N-acetyltransferase